jgi:hypothetical protein
LNTSLSQIFLAFILFKIVSMETVIYSVFYILVLKENPFVVLVIFGHKVTKKLEKGISEPQLHKVSFMHRTTLAGAACTRMLRTARLI